MVSLKIIMQIYILLPIYPLHMYIFVVLIIFMVLYTKEFILNELMFFLALIKVEQVQNLQF